MTINREHLAPCPFCGSTKISYSTHQIGIAVGCDSCGAVCEIKGSKEQCAEAWNRRAQAAPEAEPVAWVRRSGRFGCKQYMTDRQYQAQSALMRANYEPYSCARCTAPQHDADHVEHPRAMVDAELIELLERMREFVEDPLCHQEMLELIDAKLATLRHV